MSRSIAALTLIALLFATAAEARDREIHYDFDRQRTRAYNIALTSFFSLLSAVVQGEVTSWPDALQHFAIGAGAGVSYYQAKRLSGDRHVTAGWLLTNVTASVVENSASGERMFGRIGYTVGPLRFRFATPWAQKAVAKIEADWSLYETRRVSRRFTGQRQSLSLVARSDSRNAATTTRVRRAAGLHVPEG